MKESMRMWPQVMWVMRKHCACVSAALELGCVSVGNGAFVFGAAWAPGMAPGGKEWVRRFTPGPAGGEGEGTPATCFTPFGKT